MKLKCYIFFAFLMVSSCEKVNVSNEVTAENNIKLNYIEKVIITNDNGLLIIGEYNSRTTIIKTDANFNISWRKDNYGWGTNKIGSWGGESSYWVTAANVFEDESGNYTCMFTVQQGGDVVYSSVLIAELDQNGTELKKIEISDIAINDAIKTTDGGYVLSGFRVTKLDQDFRILWDNNYWNKGFFPGKIINLPNDNYALTIWDSDGGSFLKILARSGEEFSSQKYSIGESPFDENSNDLLRLNDMGYIIVGRTRKIQEPWDMDYGVIRINASGEKTWTKITGTSSDEWLEKIIYSSDKDFIAFGKVGFPNAQIQKSILLKMNYDGRITDSCTVDRIEALLYDNNNYFVKAYKVDSSNFHFNKIPYNALFTLAGIN